MRLRCLGPGERTGGPEAVSTRTIDSLRRCNRLACLLRPEEKSRHRNREKCQEENCGYTLRCVWLLPSGPRQICNSTPIAAPPGTTNRTATFPDLVTSSGASESTSTSPRWPRCSSSICRGPSTQAPVPARCVRRPRSRPALPRPDSCRRRRSYE